MSFLWLKSCITLRSFWVFNLLICWCFHKFGVFTCNFGPINATGNLERSAVNQEQSLLYIWFTVFQSLILCPFWFIAFSKAVLFFNLLLGHSIITRGFQRKEAFEGSIATVILSVYGKILLSHAGDSKALLCSENVLSLPDARGLEISVDLNLISIHFQLHLLIWTWKIAWKIRVSTMAEKEKWERKRRDLWENEKMISNSN